MRRTTEEAALAVYYEHPRWFRALFAELDRRGVPYLALHAPDGSPAPGTGGPPFRVLFNRMSPSAYLRGHRDALQRTGAFLEGLERLGVRVVNGSRAFRVETSKALQLAHAARLGLHHPRTRVVSTPRGLLEAAREVPFPALVKPNVGGSGAGIRKFDSPGELEAAVVGGEVAPGPDGLLLLQEYVPPEGGRIVRVEVVGGRYLYGIRIYTTGETFDLCPADICRTVDGRELLPGGEGSAAGAPGLRVEGYEPPEEAVAEVERLAAATGIEVGGFEYLVDARTGRRCYYDMNALSNYVADGPRVVGLDPVGRLVDYLERVVWEVGRGRG